MILVVIDTSSIFVVEPKSKENERLRIVDKHNEIESIGRGVSHVYWRGRRHVLENWDKHGG